MVPFLKIPRGRRSQPRFPEGWGNTCMDIPPSPPPPKKKYIYIIYTLLAAREYKIAAGLQEQN